MQLRENGYNGYSTKLLHLFVHLKWQLCMDKNKYNLI